MKRLLILILLVLIASYWVTDKIVQDAGYVLISYQNTTIETSLWVALVLFAALVVAAYFALWLLVRLLGSRQWFRRWSLNARHRRSVSKTSRGLVDLVEGDWKNAQKRLTQSAAQSETPLINYLNAARAAAENGDSKASERLLKKAHDVAPEQALAIGLTRAEVQIQQQQYEMALATLLMLRRTHPRHTRVLALLHQTYLALKDWQALRELMPDLKKYRVLDADQLQALEQKIAQQLLQLAMKQRVDQSPAAAARQLADVWKGLPAAIRQQQEITNLYVRRMYELGQAGAAESALTEALNAKWSDALALEYGVLTGGDVKQRLKQAERWRKQHGDSASLMLTLGRLCLQNQLWGKAREYFMQSLSLEERPETHAELGRLLQHLGQHDAARVHVQQVFEQLVKALPASPLPDAQHMSLAQVTVSKV